MVSKKLEEIKESDLEALLANSVAEGKTIDYKEVLPGNADADKRNSSPTFRPSPIRSAVT
jgi:hypothetical protein